MLTDQHSNVASPSRWLLDSQFTYVVSHGFRLSYQSLAVSRAWLHLCCQALSYSSWAWIVPWSDIVRLVVDVNIPPLQNISTLGEKLCIDCLSQGLRPKEILNPMDFKNVLPFDFLFCVFPWHDECARLIILPQIFYPAVSLLLGYGSRLWQQTGMQVAIKWKQQVLWRLIHVKTTIQSLYLGLNSASSLARA